MSMIEVKLKRMTDEMYHEFFKEYENDRDLYLNQEEYQHYSYDASKVDAYIDRVKSKRRVALAIMSDNKIAGEILFKDIVEDKCATLSIVMKNSDFTNQGIGTEAERLAIDYAFEELNLQALCADTVATNTRSQHVLEKVGFRFDREEDNYKYYHIQR